MFMVIAQYSPVLKSHLPHKILFTLQLFTSTQMHNGSDMLKEGILSDSDRYVCKLELWDYVMKYILLYKRCGTNWQNLAK